MPVSQIREKEEAAVGEEDYEEVRGGKRRRGEGSPSLCTFLA